MRNVTFRPARPADEAGLARLAALDSARPPRGPALVAESGSRLLAAVPLGSGRAIADPFERTAELVELLELRKEQLAAETARDAAGPRSLRALLLHARA
jgi:hypothetical protein